MTKISGGKQKNDYNISPIVKRILAKKGITKKKDIQKFLNPSLENIVNPEHLFDIKSALKRIETAIKNQEKIYIYGDYDVDGVCATSILWECLYYDLKADALPYIPHRIEEGYGLNRNALEEIIAQGTTLVITVDCGVRDAQIVNDYKGKIDFIITDHHNLPEILPNTITVHPRHPDGKYDNGEISGGVVAWKLACALRKKFGIDGSAEKGLDLAALSTVCDIMPLIGENRAIAKFGIDNLRKSTRAGIIEIANRAGIKLTDVESYHLGFVIGPRINAAGRLDHAMDAVRLLVTPNHRQALELSYKLEELNHRRQELTQNILSEAEIQVADQISDVLLFVEGEKWPEGVIGLVAGKLTEKYKKPAIAISINGNGFGTASARSVASLNITAAISEHSSMLVRFGGHALAAGFTLSTENLVTFKTALKQTATALTKDYSATEDVIDSESIELSDVSESLYRELQLLEPFGYKNEKPLFSTIGLTISSIRFFGAQEQHLSMHCAKDNTEIEVIAFNNGADMQDLSVGSKIDLLYSIDLNQWNGHRNLRLVAKKIVRT